MTNRQIWFYGGMLFVLVLAVALVASLTQHAVRDIGNWEPIPISTLTHTPTPASGWWDEKPTPPFPSETPTPTSTKEQ